MNIKKIQEFNRSEILKIRAKQREFLPESVPVSIGDFLNIIGDTPVSFVIDMYNTLLENQSEEIQREVYCLLKKRNTKEAEKYILLVGDLIQFKNIYGRRIIYEIIGVYLGALGTDSVCELKPINQGVSSEGNQIVSPCMIDELVRIGFIKVLDRK